MSITTWVIYIMILFEEIKKYDSVYVFLQLLYSTDSWKKQGVTVITLNVNSVSQKNKRLVLVAKVIDIKMLSYNKYFEMFF